MILALIASAAQAVAGMSAPPAPALPAAEPIAAADWFNRDDYPLQAMRVAAEGRTAFRVTVGRDGRPTRCAITQSSGAAALDEATCRIILRRARFKRMATPGEYRGATRWILPIDPDDICPETVLDLLVAMSGPAKGRRLYEAGTFPAAFPRTGHRLRSMVQQITFDTKRSDRWTLDFALAEPVASLTPFFRKAYAGRELQCGPQGCGWPGAGERAATRPHILRGAALRQVGGTPGAHLICDYVPG